MKIIVNGRDRTEDVGKEIVRQAERLYDFNLTRLIEGEKDLIAIGQLQKDSDSFLGEFIRLLRFRNTIDYTEMEISSSRRMAFLYFVRKMLWKLVNPFHHWFAFKQNSVNRSLLYAIEFEREERRREITTLKSELEKIKRNKQEASNLE